MNWSTFAKQLLDAGLVAFLYFLANTFTSESPHQEQRRSRHEEESSSPEGAGGVGSTAAGEDPFHTSAGNSESMMKAAFELFGMSIDEARRDPAAARTRLEKERRKLALRYHPDRNPENLEEAHRQMQRLNACYAICTRDLDEHEGGSERTEDDKENESDSGADTSYEEEQESRYQTEEDRQKAEKEREQERRKQERDQRNKERKEEREWKQHLASQERKVRAEVRRVHLESQGITKRSKGTSKGKKMKKKKRRGPPPRQAATPPAPAPERFTPPQAHAIWKDEVEQILSWWTPEEVLHVPKPIQHTMASNPHFVAAAIRVGATDVALEQIQAQAYMAWYSFAPNRWDYGSPTAVEWMAALHFVSTDPVDEDMNTLFHYISNYEDRNLFEFLMMGLGPTYADAILKTNVWGQVPAEYCVICKDRSFKERIDTATVQARKDIQDRQNRQSSSGRQTTSGELSTGEQTSTQFRQVVEIWRCTDWLRLVHFLFAVGFVGPSLFQHGWLKSFAPFALLQHSSVAVITIYLGLWISRSLLCLVAGRFMSASYPVWVYLVLPLPLLVEGVRDLAIDVVVDFYESLAFAIGKLETFVNSHLRSSRMAKVMTPSQLECIELITYSGLWWVASSIANGQYGLH